jgi:hypothetical protein
MAGTRSIWLGALLLAGCGFEAPPFEDEMDMVPDMTGTVERKCATDDDSLRLCIDFEDTDPPAGDGSGLGHDPMLAVGLTTMTRDDELAVEMSSQSRLQIAEHAHLDITTNLTVSMWMKNEALPTAGAYWMLDNNKQYAMSLQSDGQIRCGLGLDTIDSIASLTDQDWHHVACTYDGMRLKVYIDGWVAGCKSLTRPIATDGAEGLAIGSNIGVGPTFTGNYVGGLDNIQVFARTWSESELCAANGSSWCNSSCL